LRGGIVVVKIGSLSESTFGNAHAAGTLEDVQRLWGYGMNVVVVHGGGKEVTEAMKSRGLQPEFVDGLRKTDRKALEVLMEVMPRIGSEIAKRVYDLGGKAKHVLGYEKLLRAAPIKELDYVGNVAEVNAGKLYHIMDGGLIPIVTPLGFNNGDIYNLNGDTAAGAIAAALKSTSSPTRLVFVTNVDGVMENSTLLRVVDGNSISDLLRRGVIDGGMKPKVEAGLMAARSGVERVSLINGKREHALFLEMESDRGTGTVIVA
jgi:acetylglutamate kinase